MTMPSKIIPFHRPSEHFAVPTSPRVIYPRFALEVARPALPLRPTLLCKDLQNEHPIH